MPEQIYKNKSTWATASKSYGWTAFLLIGKRTQPDGPTFETYKQAEEYAVKGSKCIENNLVKDGFEYEPTQWGWKLKGKKKGE